MSLSFLKKTLLYRGRSAFSKNFIGLLRANAIGSALAFAVLPFLTRLYSPADFGALGLLVAVSGILMNVATYRFDWSMPNARSKTVAAGLFAWGLIALALVTAVIMVTLVTGVFAVVIVAFESDEQIREALIRLGFLVPLAVVALGGEDHHSDTADEWPVAHPKATLATQNAVHSQAFLRRGELVDERLPRQRIQSHAPVVSDFLALFDQGRRDLFSGVPARARSIAARDTIAR